MDVYLSAYKRYIKLLFKFGDLAMCLERACNLVEFYPEDIYAYEWICKIYCENYASDKKTCLDFLKNPIDIYASKLLELNEKSSLGLLVKAISSYESQQYVAARELLYKVQTIQSDYEVAIKLLALCEMQVEAYGLAELLWQQLKQFDSIELATCFSYSEEDSKLKEAIKILKNKNSDKAINSVLARYLLSIRLF